MERSSTACARPRSCSKAGGPLQHRTSPRFTRLSRTGTGSLHPRLRRVDGCATPASSAGHAPIARYSTPELTFDPDHSFGAGHCSSETHERGVPDESISGASQTRRPDLTSGWTILTFRARAHSCRCHRPAANLARKLVIWRMSATSEAYPAIAGHPRTPWLGGRRGRAA